MKKFLYALICALLTLCLTFAVAGCNPYLPPNGEEPGELEGDTDESGGDTENGDTENGSETDDVNIEGFNLPKQLAAINIVTEDGGDITGDSQNQPYKNCNVTVTGGRNGEDFGQAAAQVRVRGNNTAEYEKKSFRIKFDEKVNLLGLNNGAECKNWLLLACYKDVSFLRDAVAFELGKLTLAQNGYYCSDYGYAEVLINGEYNGLYFVAEQQQVNPDRVNINEPEKGYTGTDIGYFIEYDGNASRTEDAGSYFTLNYRNYPITCENGQSSYGSQIFTMGNADYTVKNDFYSAEQVDFIKNYTDNAYKILYDAVYNNMYTTFNSDYTQIVESGFTSAKQTVESVLNLDSLVDTFIMSELACDIDIYWSSFFFTVDMSADGDKKLTFQAPWDFDSAFGMMNGLESAEGIYTANRCPVGAFGLNPWTALLFKEQWFKQAVAERLAELNESGVFERLVSLIDAVTQNYDEYFAKNYERWDNLGKVVDPDQSKRVTEFSTHKEASDYLKNWLVARIEFLNGYFNV